ncbi:hypothetical protein CUJ87_19510 [Paraburkholderia caledonica]|nr:hypothetical protein CUJ87_19510 [Paraburkholderia caledonica]
MIRCARCAQRFYCSATHE